VLVVNLLLQLLWRIVCVSCDSAGMGDLLAGAAPPLLGAIAGA
jgi:hypothetical protein